MGSTREMNIARLNFGMIGLKGKLKIKELYSLEKCHEKLIAILLVIIKK